MPWQDPCAGISPLEEDTRDLGPQGTVRWPADSGDETLCCNQRQLCRLLQVSAAVA